jgi:predicted nucleic acid-binding protein
VAYLLDTNIVCLLAPTRRRTESDEELIAWMEAHGNELRLSVVTAAEIRDGIEKARRTGATRKAIELAECWNEVRHYWSAYILPLDLETAEEAGRLIDVARAAGIDPGFEDLTIAATASVHKLTILTRNARHFRPLGVAFVNPFDINPLEAGPR